MGATGDFGKYQVVYVDPNQDAWELVDTIVHESTHVFQHMVEYIGEDAPSKEFEAYGIAFISTTLLKELARHQKGIDDALYEGPDECQVKPDGPK